MKPSGHIAASVAIGGDTTLVTREPLALVSAFAAGVMIDIDHAIDYYRWFIARRNNRVILPLHGWEYVVVACLAGALWGWSAMLLAGILSYAVHLVGDQWGNRARPLTYSFVYRAAHGFRIGEVSNWSTDGSATELYEILLVLPWGKRYASALMRLLSFILPSGELRTTLRNHVPQELERKSL